MAGWTAAVTGVRRRLANWPPVVTPLVVLLAATILLCGSGLDTWISQRFFAVADQSWPFRHVQPWRTLYEYGELPALLLGVGGLAVAAGSLVTPRVRRWRTAGLFLGLSLLLGPGLLVNGILKPSWGRPRPSQLAAFGGTSEYAPVWSPATRAGGRSFPSGHASMGFFLLVPAFLVYHRNRRLAVLLLVAGLCAGGAVGMARIVQGRHFASDVLWSAACVYYSALFLAVLLRLDRAAGARTDGIDQAGGVLRMPESGADDGYREAA